MQNSIMKIGGVRPRYAGPTRFCRPRNDSDLARLTTTDTADYETWSRSLGTYEHAQVRIKGRFEHGCARLTTTEKAVFIISTLQSTPLLHNADAGAVAGTSLPFPNAHEVL